MDFVICAVTLKVLVCHICYCFINQGKNLLFMTNPFLQKNYVFKKKKKKLESHVFLLKCHVARARHDAFELL
jgi:hypothetical protein